ncbi:MAG: alpha/beta hydrolase [Chloroflexota bacterium]
MTTPLLLLHGALGAVDQFDRLVPLLADDFEVHCLDFEGHGQTPIQHETFHSDHFVENVTIYLDQHNLETVDIFGYSLGGYVASILAQQQPERVRRIVALSTKFLWDAATAERECKQLDVEKIKDKVPRFAEMLAKRHTAEGWENVVNRSQDLLRANGEAGGLTPQFMATLSQPIRILVGDRDHTVSVEEGATIYRVLQQGELEILPKTPHPFERVPLERLVLSLKEFLGRTDR